MFGGGSGFGGGAFGGGAAGGGGAFGGGSAFGGGGGGAFGGGAGGGFGAAGGGFGQAGQAGGGFGASASFGQAAGGGFGQAQSASGFGAGASAFGGAGANPNANPNGDKQVTPPPADGVSCLKFSPAQGGRTHLASTSWDGNTVCYQIDASGNSTVAVHKQHPQGVPALCCDWHPAGDKIFAGFGDNSVQMLDLQSQALTTVGQHNAPVKCTAWSSGTNMLITGSWDKTLKFWTPGNPNPQASINLPERAYCMDLRDEYLVVGCANRKVQIFDVRNPNAPLKSEESPLKYQTRTVAIFPDKDGYAIGSIEGKVGIQYFQQQGQNKHFSFRCHRQDQPGNQGQHVYAVNCIAFNNQYKTFATCGSDGMYYFWDKTNRQRLKQFKALPQPITAACFSHDSTIFAYASCYDWHKGLDGYNPADPKNIWLHSCKAQELQQKKKR